MAKKPLTLAQAKSRIKSIQEKFPQPPEDYTYNYLLAVYRLRKAVGRPIQPEVDAYLKTKHGGLHHNVAKQYFRVLIELTASWINPKMKSRYANALLFALEKKVLNQNLIDFMKQQGGIKACDEKYRKSQK